MSLTKITTHDANALAWLITQYKAMPSFEAWLSSYSEQIQDLENVIIELITKLDIDLAVGDQLDILGNIVGQDRGALSDDEYRAVIKARIGANVASGTPADVINVISTALANTTNITYTDGFPAGFTLNINEVVTIDGTVLASLLYSSKPAGVNGILEWYEDSDSFQFTTSGAVETDADKGFGDDTLTTPGGLFASGSVGA